MLSHESIENYYQGTFDLLFYDARAEIVNNFTLDDFENMLPYERDIYAGLIKNKVEKIMEKRKKQN